jgi:hypothetical protein
MATIAQITANQANAQHSTGPKTPEGKARVAQNAVRHGLTSTRLVVRKDEHEEFAGFRDALVAELDPQGAVEQVTFDDLLHAAWNLHRFRRIEAEISRGNPDDFTDPDSFAVLDRLSRYQARAQRAYYRAVGELRKLQTNRALRGVKLDEEAAAEVPAIADINNLTKQTHSEVTAEAMKQAIGMMDYQTSLLQLDAARRSFGPPALKAPSPAPACPGK